MNPPTDPHPAAADLERLAGIRVRVAGTTPGPWEAAAHTHPTPGWRCLSCGETVGYYLDHPHALDCEDRVAVRNSTRTPSSQLDSCAHGPLLSYDDAAFAAAARTDVPWLLEQVETLTRERNLARRLLTGVAQSHRKVVECGNVGCLSRQWPGLHCAECDEPGPCPTLRSLVFLDAPHSPEAAAQVTWELLEQPRPAWGDLSAAFRSDLAGTLAAGLAAALER